MIHPLMPQAAQRRPTHAAPTRARRAVALLASTLALVAGCAVPSKPVSTEQLVRERATARWQRMIERDLDVAYGFINPATRALVPLEVWRSRIGTVTRWKVAEVKSVTCVSQERCTVTLSVTHQPMAAEGSLSTITSSIDETWLIDGGQWWLFEAV